MKFSLCEREPLNKVVLTCVLGIALTGQMTWAQLSRSVTKPETTLPAPAELPQDALGRNTPRGSVLGFLTAGYSRNFEVAAQYLNTRLPAQEAANLAEQLFYVLDRRLPAKLSNLSNDPQGSLSNPLDLHRELVGSVASEHGTVEIYLELVDRGNNPLWLFSRQTLAEIPDVYDEINSVAVENAIPEFLLRRYFGFSLFAWLFFPVLMPLLYASLSLVNSLLGFVAGYALRRIRKRPEIANPRILPHPIRLLIVAGTIHWTCSRLSISLLSRQIGTMLVTVISVVAFVWLLILLNGRCEAYFKRRMESRGRLASTAVLRPTRRLMDFIALVAGLFIALHSFGINPTAAMAGLGVGGIAIALAAQKTLENVIGGASIIFDEAVRVGDTVKVGDVIGTIEEIGLRSTRVRTLDRTVVAIPNGQMATLTLENYSARDSFWLRHVLAVRYESASPGIAQ